MKLRIGEVGNSRPELLSPHASRRLLAQPFVLQKATFSPTPPFDHQHPFKMVLISSKRLIQVHAVVLVVIAGYLIKNPEYITDSDLVFMMGETLRMV